MGRYRRYWIALAVVVALVGAYALVGFLAVPHFARNSLQNFVRTHYGRTLTVGGIQFNPFTFTLEVTGLSLPDADGQRLLSFERLHVDFRLAASLWRLGPSFGEIRLEQPYARAVIRRDGALNLADLGKGFPAAPAKPQPSTPLQLYIARFEIVTGAAYFEDRTRPTPFSAEFKPIAFELHDFSTTGRRSADAYSLEAASPEGERLRWSGTLRLEPLLSHGTFEITDLRARTVWNYLRASLPFEIDSGMIGLKGEYDVGVGNAGAGLGVRVNVQTATVSRLGIRPKGTAQDYIDVGNIALDDTRVDLASRTVEVTKVSLSDGDIKAWMSAEGGLNLLELLGASAAPTPPASPAASPVASPPVAAPGVPAPPAAGASVWRLSVPELTIERFKVSAEDRRISPAASLLLNPLNLRVAGFSTAPGATLDITFETGINDAGKLSVRAKAAPGSGAVSAHVEVSDLGLTMLQPYIAHYTSMTLLKGTLGSRLDVERQADGTLKVKGNTVVADLRTVDNQLRQDFIRWKALRVADLSYVSQPARLRIGSITALEPYARVIIAPDRRTNVGEILTPPGAAKSGTAAAAGLASGAKPPPHAAHHRPAGAAGGAAPKGQAGTVQTATVAASPVTPFPVTIGAVRVVNGSANYSDLWIKPSFAIGIQSLGGSVSGLSSDPRSRAKVQLDGKVERYSPITIAGTVNLLSAALYTDIRMSFKDLDLTVVNPYSGYFTGYRINKGKLAVDVSYKIDQRKLAAAQHFVVDQLEIGDRVDSPDATHLPLKLAVALLKDRNGVIDLNLPMNGSLDDPTFRIGPIIWKMFVNLIVKAATAPFALLSHLFGGGEHMNIVEFQPGSAQLDDPAKGQLASLAKSLEQRPQLQLDVPMVFSKGLDRATIAATRLRAELLTRVGQTAAGRAHPQTAGELALADPKKHFRLLVEQYRDDLGKQTPLPPSAVAAQEAKNKDSAPYDPAIKDLDSALIDHIAVPDSDLEALGKQRAQAIQDALVSGGNVAASRVFIVNAPPKPDSGDTVKVELTLK
jgi:Domain of Unknown Function (DUF748)